MKVAIIIPARYGSTRFPGKPLVQIAGESMLSRVVGIGRAAADSYDGDVTLLVATEDRRIADHCADIGVDCVLTSDECHTGSDRVLEAAQKSGDDFDYIFSFQGDAPFTPKIVLTEMLDVLKKDKNKTIEVITPVHQLSWEALDKLREAKKDTPFSGTTVTRAPDGMAHYFSKNIIPALRTEDKLRYENTQCPVFQHIGVYGYRKDVLEEFVATKQSANELNEGLEQLRLLDMGKSIFTVKVKFPEDSIIQRLQGGIDSPEDVVRAEKLLASTG